MPYRLAGGEGYNRKGRLGDIHLPLISKGERKMKTCWMPLIIGIIGAIILVVFGFIAGEAALFAFALAVLSAGFGISAMLAALQAEKSVARIRETMERIEALQEEIKKTQEEHSTPSRPILATLESLTQYYMDYLARQKKGDEHGEGKQD
jgi:uncharacterized integral membrane protein